MKFIDDISCSLESKNLLKDMLNPNQKERLSAREVLIRLGEKPKKVSKKKYAGVVKEYKRNVYDFLRVTKKEENGNGNEKENVVIINHLVIFKIDKKENEMFFKTYQ